MRKLLVVALLTATVWAAEPDIVINNLTGSDTTTSGAPSGFGPFSAVATCDTNGVGTTVIDWVGNPLAGVPTDGSAALWMATASGRRWSKITARAADTVTVADSFNIPAGTPVDCAVGGKRASLSATRQFQDVKAGWGVNIEQTGTDYTHAAPVTGTGNLAAPGFPRVWVRGTGASRPNLVWSSNSIGLDNCGSCYIENLRFVNTSGVKAAAFAFQMNVDYVLMRDVIVDGWGNFSTGSAGEHGTFYRVEVLNNTISGFGLAANSSLVLSVYSHNNGAGSGFDGDRLQIVYSIAANNTGNGFNSPIALFHATAYNNTLDGYSVPQADNGYMLVSLLSTNNGSDGCASPTAGSSLLRGRVVDNNAYFANGAGAYNGCPVGPNDVTLVNPNYVNAGAFDWAVGAAIADLGWPDNALAAGVSSTTFTNTEPGASQRQGGGGANFAY